MTCSQGQFGIRISGDWNTCISKNTGNRDFPTGAAAFGKWRNAAHNNQGKYYRTGTKCVCVSSKTDALDWCPVMFLSVKCVLCVVGQVGQVCFGGKCIVMRGGKNTGLRDFPTGATAFGKWRSSRRGRPRACSCRCGRVAARGTSLRRESANA